MRLSCDGSSDSDRDKRHRQTPIDEASITATKRASYKGTQVVHGQLRGPPVTLQGEDAAGGPERRASNPYWPKRAATISGLLEAIV